MKVEEKSDRWFKEKYGNEGFTYIEEEIRKICFEDGYKECEKEKKECQDFIWESVGFKKRGFVNSIQIAEYIEKLEKENAELKQDKKDLIFVRNAKADHINELKDQLVKAKEIIERLISDNRKVWVYSDVREQAEQFLKEIEK